MTLIKAIVILGALLFSQASQADEKLVITGEVFDLSGQKKLFDYNRFTSQKGSLTTQRNEFRDLSGKLVLNEKAQIQKGLLHTMNVDQPQTGESGSIIVKDKKVIFKYKDANGKLTHKTEDLPENFHVHMTIIPFLQKNWKKLNDGESLRVRMGVWQRAETIGFKIWKDSEIFVNGKKQTVLVMKISTMILRLRVDPIYFTFKSGGLFLDSVKGRTSPKIKDEDGQWKDLDALIRYKNRLLTF